MPTHSSRRSSTAETMRISATAQFTFDGMTALVLVSCLLMLGCDAADDRSLPRESSPSVEPDPELGAGTSAAPNPSADDETLAAAAPVSGVFAVAELEPTAGSQARGQVELRTTSGGLVIDAQLSGLEPGTHGIHIHEFGDCSAPDASSAGDHFSPADAPHGAPRDPRSERHAGDLGNITAEESGNASKRMVDSFLTLDDNDFGVVGLAIVVHADEDDLTSQPSGESGDPVACGVVELVQSGRG
jgi:superoxide dismutase, Cu-Zn family